MPQNDIAYLLYQDDDEFSLEQKRREAKWQPESRNLNFLQEEATA